MAAGHTPQDPAGSGLPASPQGGASRDPEAKIETYTTQLNLSDSQQDELRKIFRQMGQKMAAARNTMGAGPGGGAGTLRAQIRKSSQVAIVRILDADQRARFEALQAEDQPKRGTLWRLDDNGQPEAVPVLLGSSDAAYTEISGHGIAADMQVICGLE